MGKNRLKSKCTQPHPPEQKPAARDSSSSPSTPISEVRLKVVICVLLAAITLAAYWQVFGFEFITGYDDKYYVVDNPFVNSGLSLQNLKWAFTTFHCANWHPLTWISHMLDSQIYGLNPAGHHATNLLFHAANALILFLLLCRITGAVWRSGFVAALFALHPMHVESVAWVAERKDVLSTLFWFLTVYAYVLYAKRPSIARYVPVVVAFGLGLMSKPMLVSLPIVLLILDYWPLNRMNLKWRLVWEKAPLLAMSAASCVVTVIAQRAGDAVVTLADVPLLFRLGNAAISYVGYVLMMLWPKGLAICYPHQGAALPILPLVGAVVALAAVTWFVIWNRVRRPYLMAGWLWYLVTLLPVIGLVQVGLQAMADRYSYIPLTGLFIMIAWGVSEMISHRGPSLRRMLPVSAVALVAVLTVCTWFQVRSWRDSYTLFDHAIRVTRDNHVAYSLRGAALDGQGRSEEAIDDFVAAIELQPNFPDAHNGLALSLLKSNRIDEGIAELQIALRLGMRTSELYLNLALAHYVRGELDIAAEACRTALELDPRSAGAHNVMGAILGAQGHPEQALPHLKLAVELDPDLADPHGNLATTYFLLGDYAAAWREVHIFENKGGQPNTRLIADLSRKMPDPGP